MWDIPYVFISPNSQDTPRRRSPSVHYQEETSPLTLLRTFLSPKSGPPRTSVPSVYLVTLVFGPPTGPLTHPYLPTQYPLL